MTVKVKGMLKIVLPSRIRYPFSGQWKITEVDLEALRTSTNGFLKTAYSNISTDSDKRYCLSIYPNGNKDQRRGETWIFLQLYLGAASKIEAVFNLSIDSLNYSFALQHVYDKSEGYGISFCSTYELFNVDYRYSVDGELVIKFTGTFSVEKQNVEPTILACEKGVASKAYQRHKGKEFTIIAGEKKIKIHKKVLTEASPVLEAMFRSGMKEVAEKKGDS